MKTALYKLSSILVSVLFVYLAVRRVDLSESLQVLGSIDLWWLLAGTLVYLLLALPIRAVRWRRILRNQKTLAFGEALIPLLVGQMAIYVLPARTGELYRAHFLGQRAKMSRSSVVGSIVVERTFDIMILVGMMLLLFLLFPQAEFLGGAALATTLTFLALAAGILFYGVAPDRTHGIIDKMLSLLPQKLGQFINLRLQLFMNGIRGISTTRSISVLGFYTICAWLLEACAIALVLGSFGVLLTLSGFVLVYALSTLATILPSGPGYAGPYQYAFILSLGASGISQETALAVSLAVQIALFGSVTVVGLILLWREHSCTQWPLKRENLGLEDEANPKKRG